MNLQLSDGTVMQVPDDATPEAIRNFAARGEAHIKANPAAPPPQGGADPNSFRNVAGRVTSDAVMGIPDLLIAAANVITKPGDKIAEWITGEEPASASARIPSLAPQLRKEWNVAELPEDAPYWQRIAEGAASGLPYGAAGIARAGAGGAAAGGVRGAVTAGARELGQNTLLPTVLSDAGARAGGAIGGETGQLIGGLAGGMVPGRGARENWVQGRYTGRGDPNAPAIAAAGERLGIEPTAGALGNYEVQKRENAFAAANPAGPAATEQTRIRDQMTQAGQDIGARRGGTNAPPAAIGEDIRGAAADRLQADRDYSSAGQENLQRDIGDRTPVRVIDIINEARQAWPHLSVPGRQSLEARIVGQLYPLISQRDAHGNPVIGPNTTVPYELVKQWRTELGRSFDQGNVPRNRELYEPATRAMADTATGAGIPRGQFADVQAFTRGVEGEGGLAERLAPFDKESGTAHDYVLGEAGLRRPERLETWATETAGDPRQANVFGSRIQQEARDTLGSGQAQGPNKFAQFVEQTDPRALVTIGGPEISNVRDLGTLARGVDTPTSARGLSTSVSGVSNPLVNKILGSELLGQVGQAIDPILAPIGRGIGWATGPVLRHYQERMMQSDAAKRGMLGQPLAHNMTLDDLARTLAIIGRTQQQPGEQ